MFRIPFPYSMRSFNLCRHFVRIIILLSPHMTIAGNVRLV
jgi:hypothetical protein